MRRFLISNGKANNIMWALRRAAQPLRQGYNVEAFGSFGHSLDIASNVTEDQSGISKPTQTQKVSSGCLLLKEFTQDQCSFINFSVGHCGFSSLSGGGSLSKSDDLEDEVGAPTTDHMIEEGNVEKECKGSGPELAEDGLIETSPEDFSGIDMVPSNEHSQTDADCIKLLNAIVAARGSSIHDALNKWVEEGNDCGRAEIYAAINNLRRHRMYGKALQFLEWVEVTKRLKFIEQDYASRLDLIGKLYGLRMAEKYFEKIPNSFRGQVVYNKLLANCVIFINLKKAENVIKKMRELEFPLNVYVCNQMILLYKRLDKKKITNVIHLMEKENIKPSLVTYKLLIDTKGENNDIKGMEQLIKNMTAEGIDPDILMHTIIARHYIRNSLTNKAEAILKEIELKYLNASHGAHGALLRLYAYLGKADDVCRIWDACKMKPNIGECMAAIEAWGELGEIDKAEAVFETMLQKWKLSSRNYCALLKVYVKNRMLTKGKEFVKRMGDSGCWVGPLTWDALVRLAVEAGDVEKAESVLEKAAEQNWMRPMFNSYMVVMDQYAKQGNVHKTEKLFYRMRHHGYTGRLKPFELLIKAYINANAPAYGFLERMKAENIFPNKPFGKLLSQADPFKNKAVSYLFD